MRPARFFRLLRAFALDCDGISAIELAICLPLMVGMILPMVDLGMGAYTKMELVNAAQAGAQYAAKNGFNATNIGTAVTSATSMSGVSANPAPAESCGCVSGTTITNVGTPPCSGSCASGTVGTFVTVNAQVSYSTLFPYPGIASPVTLSAQSMIRIQ
jgi:Flp pilus assembly protein TadG